MLGTTDLAPPTHFLNEATTVQRGCDALKDTQPFGGIVRSEPTVLNIAGTASLYHSAFSSLNRGLADFSSLFERLDSIYFRFLWTLWYLSLYSSFIQKNHNFHFLKFLIFTKVTHFSRESMVVGGRLNIIEILPHYGQRLFNRLLMKRHLRLLGVNPSSEKYLRIWLFPFS